MIDVSLCRELSCVFGPSGLENQAADVVQRTLSLPSFRDAMQNVFVSLPANHGAPHVLLDAHLDEVGLMVQSVTSNGLLRVVPIGGWVEHNLPAHLFLIRTRKGEIVRAVSASKPPHFMTAAERSAPLTMESILLDAGVSSREQAEELGLEPGLFVVPDADFSIRESDGVMMGKAFDCRLGCAALIECMRELAAESLSVDVTAVFSSQEEVGTRGARVAAHRVSPHLAICFEGTPADDTFTPPGEAQGAVGKGVQLRFRDNSMIANPTFMEFARTVAEECGITHQCAVRTGGGTNAGAIHLAESGIPTIVLGIPVRYAHTHYGVSSLCDVASAAALGAAILRRLTPEIVEQICPA